MNRNEPAQHGKILVVDDAMENVRILHAVLKDEHEVVFALDGTKALEIARTQAPDLILLDAIMPAMDGYAVCARLQESPETRDIPIIFVTALDGSEDEARALAAGAVDFIHKPINGAVVQARVNTHLTLKRQRDQLRESGILLSKANEALLRSNRELEHFAHLAAHDLQAPLNAIAGCTRILSEEYADKLCGQGQKFLGYVLDNTRRMQTLIQDLLAYSRLDSQVRQPELINIKTVLDDVLFILDSQISAANAVVACSELPTLRIDRQQMTQLLMNLIGNGIKYNRKERPQISVSACREGEEWRFTVADNGIGISPQFHQQIFEIFRRLHSSQEYPGSGIGLASCHRIVTRHGGRIWVDSREGEGSVFHFTLPVENQPLDCDAKA